MRWGRRSTPLETSSSFRRLRALALTVAVAALLLSIGLIPLSLSPFPGIVLPTTLYGWPMFIEAAWSGDPYYGHYVVRSKSALIMNVGIGLLIGYWLQSRTRSFIRNWHSCNSTRFAVSVCLAVIGLTTAILFEMSFGSTPRGMAWVSQRPFGVQILVFLVLLWLWVTAIPDMGLLLAEMYTRVSAARCRLPTWRGWPIVKVLPIVARLQFSLRATLVFITCCGVVCWAVRRAHLSGSAAIALREAGATIQYADETAPAMYLVDLVPAWLKALFGPEYCRTVVGVTILSEAHWQPNALAPLLQLPSIQWLTVRRCFLSKKDVDRIAECRSLRSLSLGELPMTDGSLSAIDRLHSLTRLCLTGAPLTDEVLVIVGNLPHLVELDVSDTRIRGPGLMHLARVSRLKSINLAGTEIGSSALRHIAALNLESLDISRTRVDDTAFEYLTALSDLNYLCVDETNISGEFVHCLAALPSLKMFALNHTNVSDSAAAELAEIRSLEGLWLKGTRITDKALVHLSRLGRLEYIDLSDTRVSDRGVRLLARPPGLTGANLDGTDATEVCKQWLYKVMNQKNAAQVAQIGPLYGE